jgi:hypothetical protein
MTRDDLIRSLHDLWRTGVITGVDNNYRAGMAISVQVENGAWINMTHDEAKCFVRGAYAMHAHLLSQVNRVAPLAAVDVWG